MGRFAPSPSGPLHLGSLVAALASWLDARAHRGRWLLRFEDVDSERCRPEHIETIRAQLRAFGLIWDQELPLQSTRLSHYGALLDDWIKRGQAYACRCTRRDLKPFRGHGETCYPGTCRTLGLPPEGQAIRFRLPDSTLVQFEDRLLGPQYQDVSQQCGDVVLRRRSGDFTYQFAVSVDDAEQGITHVVRGDDLLSSTGRQLLLINALEAPEPCYLHHPLVHDAGGHKISKSTGASAISTSQPGHGLLTALQHLPIDSSQIDPDATPRAMLDTAIDAWAMLIDDSSGKMGF